MKPLKINFYVNRNRIISLGLIAFIVGGTLGGVLWHFGGVYTIPPMEFHSLQRFSSYEELKNFLNTTPQSVPYYYRMLPGFSDLRGLGNFATLEATKAPTPDYSTTNIQVEGVDEADIVKTDGEYIYVASGKTVVILRAFPPENAKVLSKLDLNQTVNGIFVNGDKLVVFQGGFDPSGIVRWGGLALPYPYESARTSIKVYEIFDRTKPTLSTSFTVDGYYFSSRMIGSYVYVVVNKPAYLINKEVELPTIQSDGWDHIVKIPATSIYYVNVSDYYYAFTNIIALDVRDPKKEPTHETFLLGAAANIYVSQNNLYITSPKLADATSIHKISIEEGKIAYAANGTVTGYVLNQFSMDEYDGYFRVATTKGSAGGRSSMNNVYVLDSKLNIVGRLENLAPGEEIHSARFMEDRCYLVTFKKIDPLFVIDLKDPKKPEVLGKLKIPGYSDYLHPYDRNHLIGVGKETVEAKEGDFAWYQGVKISLFDVSNVSEPKEMAMVEIGDRGTDSPVLRDQKAFLFSWSKRLLVLPALVAEIDEKKYPSGVPPSVQGDYVWQGAYVYDISLGGIVLKGRITHIEDASELLKSGYYFDSPYSVKRALYIDDVLYTISDKMIKMNSLGNLQEINKVELP